MKKGSQEKLILIYKQINEDYAKLTLKQILNSTDLIQKIKTHMI